MTDVKGQKFSQIMFTKPKKRATREHITALVKVILNDAAQHHTLEVQAWHGNRNDRAMAAVTEDINYYLKFLGRFVVSHADEIGIRHAPRRRVNAAYAARYARRVEKMERQAWSTCPDCGGDGIDEVWMLDSDGRACAIHFKCPGCDGTGRAK
jgi:hypothetical protein